MSAEEAAGKKIPDLTQENIPARGNPLEIRDIIYTDLPCWYELSWDESKIAIVLKIHQDFIKSAPPITSDTPLIIILAKNLEMGTFSGNFQSDIGFEEALKHQGEKRGFTEFVLPIPQIKKDSDKECPFCAGSGKDTFRDEECLYCSGTGRDYNMDWHTVYAASASLTAFTKRLSLYKEDTSAPYAQLLTIETTTNRGMHGGSLGGEISFPLRQWLTYYRGENNIPEVIRAMMLAHDRMFGLEEYDKYSLRVMVRKDGGLAMECPGNACGIHPTHGMGEKRGYELDCHNVDSPAQQLTLIAGLAALHDKARKEIT